MHATRLAVASSTCPGQHESTAYCAVSEEGLELSCGRSGCARLVSQEQGVDCSIQESGPSSTTIAHSATSPTDLFVTWQHPWLDAFLWWAHFLSNVKNCAGRRVHIGPAPAHAVRAVQLHLQVSVLQPIRPDGQCIYISILSEIAQLFTRPVIAAIKMTLSRATHHMQPAPHSDLPFGYR